MEIKIPFTQMTTEELFVTLTGGNGFMAQISLQQIVLLFWPPFASVGIIVAAIFTTVMRRYNPVGKRPK